MSGPALVVALTALALAAGLAVPGVTARPSRATRAAGPSGSRTGLPRAAQLAVVVAGVLAVALLPARRAMLAGIVAVVAIAVVRAVARGREEKRAEQRRALVVGYAETLVGELRAGLPVQAALERGAESWPEAARVAAAGRWGADVPAALRDLALLPGAEPVARLGAVWRLCAASGTSLATGVGHVLATARAEQATRHLVAAELASARATARMLGLLPLLVLLAGQGLGAEPWGFLLDSVPGLLCLASGSGCALLGLWWMDRIAAAAVRGGP